LDRRRCLFLTFNNSKFTGGKHRVCSVGSDRPAWFDWESPNPV
jgi:hypothetical protein